MPEATQGSRKNNLKTIRVGAGLSIAELSRRARVSDKTIRQLERGSGNHKLETKHRIVNALNRYLASTKNYTFDDVFPEG